MATADESLQAILSETEYGALKVLAESTAPPSGRKVAVSLSVSPTTANRALSTLAEAGFATSERAGRATLWRLAVSNPSISAWLAEIMPPEKASSGSSPYSTGGGGVRLEHSYAACLIAELLAGNALSELGDAVSVESIRLQASDVSEPDDIVIEGRDAEGEIHRSSIAVRRNPALTIRDVASVPLIQDFLAIVTDHWSETSVGRWRLILAVSTNANAISQLSELAELARSLPSGIALEDRLTQPGRINNGLRMRYDHIKGLVRQASDGLPAVNGLSIKELTWRLLSSLTIRSLRLERTDRADRTTAVNTLQHLLIDGTLANADALFSRIEELVGGWAPQGAILTQSVVRRSISDFSVTRSARFSAAWRILDRLGTRLRDSIDPALRAGSERLELRRLGERSRVMGAIRPLGAATGALVITGDPDIGKSALSLRAIEALRDEGATVVSLSLRDLPSSPTEFEHQLGGALIDDVLAAGEVGPLRLLLVDGAESVLEGKGQIFRVLTAAALKAGIGVVAVTRTDGSHLVRDELARATELAGLSIQPKEHVVEPLAQEERAGLPTTFSALARLANDERSIWLLGRLGLVNALLQTGAALDPAEFLCEADVYAAVWRSVIRRNEIHSPESASPDDRERTALAVAKSALGLDADLPGGTGAAELRSDGVLRLPNDLALAPGDEFVTDLFRDFALCRLFITQRWEPLNSSGAPRWSIRAARLACQAALLGPSRLSTWRELTRTFNEIARAHGDRWLEVPYEALLTLGDAESAIRDLWAPLGEENYAGLATLLRLAESRYVSGTVGDPFALAPLVKVAFCDRPKIGRGPRSGYQTIQEVIRSLVLAWLRGMATSRTKPDSLRQEVRNIILDGAPPLYDDFTVEALALLGLDLDDRAEVSLRAVAEERPDRLSGAVESVFVGLSMSQAGPKLLLDLAEAYYIERADPSDHREGSNPLADGIRDLRHGHAFGFGPPQAAWYFGPFFRLLNTAPIETIDFINRMLDHAANFRATRSGTHGRQADDPERLEGVNLDVPGIGGRRYIGDSHVWAWYRGTSVGPYACMSALLALERFIDQLFENLSLPADRIVELLLRNCHNLAMPGLVVGFLTRHLDEAGTLLDPFLASPTIWHLEIARATSEFGFRVRDAGADTLTGSDRRGHSFHETVGAMVVSARLAADGERLTRLEQVGADLLETARAELTTPGMDDGDSLTVIESWAEEFRIENYRTSRSGDQVVIKFERPDRIEQVLASRNAELQTTNALYGLQNRYGRFNDDPESWPIASIEEDLSIARAVDDSDRIPEGMLWPENALVAVAAAAVRAHAMGFVALNTSDLTWAANAVLWAAENPRIDGMSDERSMFSMGADRAAAASAPLLLLAPFDTLGLDRSRIEQCLRSLATSLFDEVRAIYVKGCSPVWAAPCELDKAGLCVRHQSAWEAATAGLLDSKLGPWDQEAQMRTPDQLPPPFHEALADVADGDILVNRLRMPLACLVDARHVQCLQSDIGDLWSALWDAHRRGIIHWWKEGYDHNAHIAHAPIARRMIEVALDGDRDIVKSHIASAAVDSNALRLLFEGFATVFTYDEGLRSRMVDFWPWSLEVALGAIGDGAELRSQRHRFDYMTAALLPTPNLRSWDPDMDSTLAGCRGTWLQPEAIGDLADRWLHLARWEARAVDAVIKLAKTASREWQVTVAFGWIETIIDGSFDVVANHLWHLEEWLTELHNADAIVGEVRSAYHRLIDGLAAAGDRAAVRLQRLDE